MEVVTLKSVLRPAAGAVIEDRIFRLAPDFDPEGASAAIYIGAGDVTLRRVRVLGSETWLPRWNAYNESAPGIGSDTAGIRAQNTGRLLLDDVVVVGFPQPAFIGCGLSDVTIRGLCASRVSFGVLIQHQGQGLNERILIEHGRVGNLWGPPAGSWPGVGGDPSRLHPGLQMGGDGFVVEACSDVRLRDLAVYGEQWGSFKVVGIPDGTGGVVEIERCRGNHLMIQGTPGEHDPGRLRAVRVRDCLCDKATGSGGISRAGIGIQVSFNAEVEIVGTRLLARGTDGHGLQLYGQSSAEVRGCEFDGWNGMRGPYTPAHALELWESNGCSINEDFASANTFRRQARLLRRT